MMLKEINIKNDPSAKKGKLSTKPGFYNEEAEFAKAWNIIKDIDNEVFSDFIYSMGFSPIVFVGYNSWTEKILSKLEGSEVEFYICTDGDNLDEEVIEKYNVGESINIILRYTDVNLIVDTDSNKYKMRSILFDGLSQESCLLAQFMGYLAYAEFPRWNLQNIPYSEEMINDLYDVITFRYKTVVIYGQGDFYDALITRLKENSSIIVEQVTAEDIKFSKSCKIYEIIKYFNFNIETVLYFGPKNDINFFKEGKKINAVKLNTICSEIAMSYDLSVDIIPKLKEKNVDTYTFLYPDFARLNYLLFSKGFPCFKRKPILEVMNTDKKWEDDIKKFFGEFYSPSYLQGILKRPSVIEKNGVKKYGAFNSDFYNIINGNRLTTDTPDNAKHTIYIFGKCVAMGRFVEDKNTIASFLQRYINSVSSDYEVVNYGIEAEVEIHKKIRKIKFKKGDIVIILYRYYRAYEKNNVDFVDMTQLICDLAIGNREYFIDTPEHFNHRVNDAIAITMFENIKSKLNDTNDCDEYFSIDDSPVGSALPKKKVTAVPPIKQEETVETIYEEPVRKQSTEGINEHIGIFKVTEEERNENTPKHVGIFKVTDEEEKIESIPKKTGIFKVTEEERNENTPKHVGIFKVTDEEEKIESIPKKTGIFKVTEEEKNENTPKHVGIFKVTDEEKKAESIPKKTGIFKVTEEEKKEQKLFSDDIFKIHEDESIDSVPIFKNSDDFDVSDILKNAAAEADDIPIFKPSGNVKPVRHHFEPAEPEFEKKEEVAAEESFDESNDIADNPKFRKYIEKLKRFKPSHECVSGAIVMNCNPFTLGHQYLIEECSRKCDILYVFVVEEDKSMFSFKDRFELVKQGTSHIKNVRVMPSGSFMISTITFPEYFTKDAPTSTVVDPSSDVELFAAHIAPALGISIRFAGEEPIDKVTKQYNDTMRKILPAYGIKFEVIERLRNGGQPISASQVRKYLEEGNFNEIIKIVPETTYSYLEKLKKK